MPFKLLFATPDDTDEVARIATETLALFPRRVIEFQNVSPEDFQTYTKASARDRIPLSDPDSDIVSIKIVDEESGELAAYAQWGFSNNCMKKVVVVEHKKAHPIEIPKGLNMEARKHFSDALEAMVARNQPEGDYFVLLELMTLPKFGRRGCGAQLVNWGLDRADREGRLTILDASTYGYGLYKKLGFREVDKCVVPLTGFGGEGEFVQGESCELTMFSMVREPKSASS